MGLNLAEIQQKLDRLIQNIAEQNRRAYQIFYDPNPQDVTLPQLDENGNLVNVTIPNRAKILADFTAWREGARIEFSSANICPNPELVDSNNDGYPDGIAFANTYVADKAIITPKVDGTTDEQIAYKLIAFALTGNENADVSTGNLATVSGKFKVFKVTADFSKANSLMIFFPANYFVGHYEKKQLVSRGCFYYLPEDYTDKLEYRYDSPYGDTYLHPENNTAFTRGFHKWLEVQSIKESSYYNFIFSARAINNYTGQATVYIALPFIVGGFSYGFGVRA